MGAESGKYNLMCSRTAQRFGSCVVIFSHPRATCIRGTWDAWWHEFWQWSASVLPHGPSVVNGPLVPENGQTWPNILMPNMVGNSFCAAIAWLSYQYWCRSQKKIKDIWYQKAAISCWTFAIESPGYHPLGQRSPKLWQNQHRDTCDYYLKILEAWIWN